MTVTDILKKLISYDTTNPPGNEAFLAGWIAEYLDTYGFETELPSCGDNRRSVIGRIRLGEGPKLVFNGHLDVVPAGAGWETDPFVPLMKGDRLYGRGAADMKGGVAAMLKAAMNIAAHPDGMCGELCLVFVADEEIINLGTISCREGWKDADYAVIGEPTEMQIEIAHKGTARFEICVSGKSCHSGMPWNGVNAIQKAAAVIEAVKKYDDSLKGITHPLLSRPSIAVTMVTGGEKDNIIPDKCSVFVDYRMIPGDTGDLVEQRLWGYLDEIRRQDDEFKCSVRRYINLEPGEVAADHPWVVQTAEVFHQVFGKKAVIRDFPVTCEQVLFVREGIPTVVIGPGSIRQAHVADEFVEVRQLDEAVDFYEALARTVLKKG